jgi:hypothetical protein
LFVHTVPGGWVIDWWLVIGVGGGIEKSEELYGMDGRERLRAERVGWMEETDVQV